MLSSAARTGLAVLDADCLPVAMVKEELPFLLLNLLTKLPTGRRTIQACLTQIHEGERVPGGLPGEKHGRRVRSAGPGELCCRQAQRLKDRMLAHAPKPVLGISEVHKRRGPVPAP